MLTIHVKATLLDMSNVENSFADAARKYGLNKSTVRYIKKKGAKIVDIILKECQKGRQHAK